MDIHDALGLHNAFRPGDKWNPAHAFSCKEPPTDYLLGLDKVYLVSPSADWIAKISESKELTSLAIKTPRTTDLGPLGKLPLIQFDISYPSRIKEWGFLSLFTRLRRLVVDSATTFTDLSYLEDMQTVEFLAVGGGYSKPLRADSLQPLGAMTSLRAVWLANIRLEDWDLSPLCRLKHLELLYTPKWCPAEEIAALRKAIPALAWNWDQD